MYINGAWYPVAGCLDVQDLLRRIEEAGSQLLLQASQVGRYLSVTRAFPFGYVLEVCGAQDDSEHYAIHDAADAEVVEFEFGVSGAERWPSRYIVDRSVVMQALERFRDALTRTEGHWVPGRQMTLDRGPLE